MDSYSTKKESKIVYFLKAFSQELLPGCYYRRRMEAMLQKAEQRADWGYIQQRVDYYNRLKTAVSLPEECLHEHHGHYYVFLDQLKHYHFNTFHSVYYIDLMRTARAFDQKARVGYVPGDVYFTPPFPALVKSRLLGEYNGNSVVLKLDSHRHFRFVEDSMPFAEKKHLAIFRGKIRLSRERTRFMEMYFGSKVCDCGIVERLEEHPEWTTPRVSLADHLKCKYILSLEGNDVATNLKWVMSSNSIAVMPRPTCETWFMEGKLIPDYHYIALKDDLSDLEERMDYYTAHPDEAQQIIDHAHEFVAQFMDEEREEIIGYLVLKRYLELTK